MSMKPKPISRPLPYGRHNICEADIQAVVDVLNSEFLTQGPCVPVFEERIANYCDARYAVAVNSATSALHIGCLALGVEAGDLVWTSPITFVASANCALYCNADIDFVDVDGLSGNLSVPILAARLEQARKIGRLPKVLIPVHLCGQPCDMEGIHALRQRYGFRIIEDASHAIGAQYRGASVGNGQFSDITVFSFHPVKLITTGEGGVAVTNDPTLAGRLRRLRSHGITRDAAQMTHPPDGPWYYQQLELGFNYRMSELHAALGCSQLKRLDEFVTMRHSMARRYDELLADLPIAVPPVYADRYSALHLYSISLKLDEVPMTRRAVVERLHQAGVGVGVHYIPVYRQPFYERRGFQAGYCPNAERYYEAVVSLPIYPGLTAREQEEVADALRDALSAT